MERGTVIFVSHNTAAVQSLCSRAVWIDHGEVKFIGSAKEAAERYLAALYESEQGASQVDAEMCSEGTTESATESPPAVSDDPRDMRLDFLNCTQFRNDIEIFEFDVKAAAFGKGHGRIIGVRLMDPAGAPLTWVVGGEEVVLEVQCLATTEIRSPIVGFFVKDHLGQNLFGDNTYLTYSRAPLSMDPEERWVARFAFRMPVIPAGDYTVAVALAEGTQQQHIQHHWIHDALALKSHSSSYSQGLVGIPMRRIELRRLGR
jgi:lipopolysaccharide transport system ATP-binding protein